MARAADPPIRPRAAGGFTLIEVLVAFVVVAVVLSLVLGVFSGGLSVSRRADDRAMAALYASSVLAATGREQPLTPGYAEGRFDDGFAWQRWIEPYLVEPLFEADAGLFAYRVVVRVRWPAAKGEDGVTVSTLRIDGSAGDEAARP
jgi:general secretion pathway protein I